MQFTKSIVAIFFTLLASVLAGVIPGGESGRAGGAGGAEASCPQGQSIRCCNPETKNVAKGFFVPGFVQGASVFCNQVDTTVWGGSGGNLKKECSATQLCCATKDDSKVKQEGLANGNFDPSLECFPVTA